jgi:predicted Ser/Thr protein kinase
LNWVDKPILDTAQPIVHPVPGSIFARMATCYPWRNPLRNSVCRAILSDLGGCRVSGFLSAGKVVMSWGRIIGKGHASIVAAGLYEDRVVAVKIRRTDSKHESFLEEARVQRLAWKAGVAPRLYCYRDNVIVMDLVTGTPLGSLETVDPGKVSLVLSSVYALDKMGVYHHELSRPWRHIVLTDGNAVIIDYGSSSLEYCRNLPRVVSALLVKKGVRISDYLKELLSAYKDDCTRSVYSSIKKRVLEYFE